MMILIPNGSGGLFPMFFPDGDSGDGPNIPKWIVILWLIIGVIGSLLCTYLTYLDPFPIHDWFFWVMTTIFFFSWIFLGPLSFLVAFIIWITL